MIFRFSGGFPSGFPLMSLPKGFSASSLPHAAAESRVGDAVRHGDETLGAQGLVFDEL